MADYEGVARRLYELYTENRYAEWDDLDDEGRRKWLDDASTAVGDEPMLLPEATDSVIKAGFRQGWFSGDGDGVHFEVDSSIMNDLLVIRIEIDGQEPRWATVAMMPLISQYVRSVVDEAREGVGGT